MYELDQQTRERLELRTTEMRYGEMHCGDLTCCLTVLTAPGTPESIVEYLTLQLDFPER